MGHDGPSAAEIEEALQRLSLSGRARHHRVRDAGQARDFLRDGSAGVHEGVELSLDLAAGEENRADLDQSIPVGIKTGGLGVEGDELRVQRLFTASVDGQLLVHVVDEIALDAVDNLDAVLFPRVPRVGESLRAAVVRDGDGPVTPVLRPLDRFGHVGQCVQRREGGM